MTKRKQEKEEVENAAPDNSHFDIMSEISQESTLPNISGQEYKHIMVIIDAFSRYVKLFPLKAVTSEETAHASSMARAPLDDNLPLLSICTV